LVNPPFESHPDFFYPPPEPVTLVLAGRNDVISTREADVRLADLPFIRLRDELDQSLPYEQRSYSEAVERAQEVLCTAELDIDLDARTVHLQGHSLSPSATQFLWLVWLADRARREMGPIPFDESALDELDSWVTYLEGTGPHTLRDSIDKARAELAAGERTNYFDRNRSRLNEAIERHSGLPQRAAKRYQVHSEGQRGRSAYVIALAPEQIRITGDP
jgi:hypothetical protein